MKSVIQHILNHIWYELNNLKQCNLIKFTCIHNDKTLLSLFVIKSWLTLECSSTKRGLPLHFKFVRQICAEILNSKWNNVVDTGNVMIDGILNGRQYPARYQLMFLNQHDINS